MRIAVLTSGGDAPGMNAAIRAVVRAGEARGLDVFGVRHGFTGLIAGDLRRLGARDVGGIVERGGTMLGTTRCEALKTEAGLRAAVDQARQWRLDGLVVVGGNGSHAGALALASRGVAVIGLASTIDNDLPGSDVTIGATTAVDTALEAIDRLRVTAAAHGRVFLVEVMGRNSGHLALAAAIAGGAEAVVVPEIAASPDHVAEEIRGAHERGKSHAIVVVAEGAKFNADALQAYFSEHQAALGFELRVSKLGHIQRGGAPGVFDRLLASRLGIAAVAHLAEGRHGVSIGVRGNDVATTVLEAVTGTIKPLDPRLLTLARVLAL